MHEVRYFSAADLIFMIDSQFFDHHGNRIIFNPAVIHESTEGQDNINGFCTVTVGLT